MTTDAPPFAVTCEWGMQGLVALLPAADVVVIVDVLSFSTAVEVAVSRGAWVYPAPDAASAAALADDLGAELASRERGVGYSLSPVSLQGVPPGTRLVLPSPNGGALSSATGATPTLAGCLRNASAVARAAASLGERVAVVAAGERWPDGTLRPAIEDWLGAGAIVAHLPGDRSPEAESAAEAFRAALPAMDHRIRRSASGRELVERGFAEDVLIASQHDSSVVVPILRDGAYVARTG